jgi:hypothetical protein
MRNIELALRAKNFKKSPSRRFYLANSIEPKLRRSSGSQQHINRGFSANSPQMNSAAKTHKCNRLLGVAEAEPL